MGVFGRSPSGRAIRYIFFALIRQKRMPLLSLTQHSKCPSDSSGSFHQIVINNMRKLEAVVDSQ